MLLEAFRTDILDAFVLNYIHPNCPLLKFNLVLISLFIPLGEMPPKMHTRSTKAKVHKASDAESDRAPIPPPRGRGYGQGRGRGILAKHAKGPAPEEEPIYLVAEMRGVLQTFNSLVELLTE